MGLDTLGSQTVPDLTDGRDVEGAERVVPGIVPDLGAVEGVCGVAGLAGPPEGTGGGDGRSAVGRREHPLLGPVGDPYPGVHADSHGQHTLVLSSGAGHGQVGAQ